MSWNQRYRAMLKGMGYKTQDIADITGNKKSSIQSVTKPSSEFPRWLKLAIVIYETLTKKYNELLFKYNELIKKEPPQEE